MEKDRKTSVAQAVAGVIFGNATNYTACLYALLVLRLWLGVTFLAHGGQKLFGWWGGPGFHPTVAFISTKVSASYPELLTVLLIIAEFGGGIAFILGIMPRLFAVAIVIEMVVALSTVHRGQGFMMTFGQQMIIASCVAIIIGGGGAWALWPAARGRSVWKGEADEEDGHARGGSQGA